MYARGLVPVKMHDLRERHGTDDEILVGRMIDRALRPLFAPGYVDEMQIMVTNHSADGIGDPTILGLNAASCALMQSKAPWSGPVGCVRIGKIDGVLKVNPTIEEMKQSTLDLVYAGTAERPTM
jgi:polyribonucleotide nucleotidyltransferase